MKRLILAANCLALAGIGFIAMPVAHAAPAAIQDGQDEKTEDVLYLIDGRILHGKLLDETYSTYLFQYVDRKLALTTEMSIPKSDVVKIERDVAVTDIEDVASSDEGASMGAEEPRASSRAEYSAEAMKERYGATLATDSEGVPTFYVVPMKGQMGTDITSELFQEVVEDIRRAKPDVVIFALECNQTSGQNLFDLGFEQEKDENEHGLYETEDYKEIVAMFRMELRDVPQVMWVHDSEGISSMVAMAWDKIYMVPNARLGGLLTLLKVTGANLWPDPNVRAKMMAALVGGTKSFLEVGGYDEDLAEAMLNPEHSLSGDWAGRRVEWMLNGDGEVVVDASNRHTADFVAKTAEDYGISQGTAETLDDLAILLGYREYRLLEGTGAEIVEGYSRNWRRAFETAQKHLDTYLQNVSGGDLPSLSRARTAIRAIQGLIRRYVPVERRMMYDFGVTTLQLTILEEQLNEAIAVASRNRDRGRGNRNRGGGGVGTGGGGNGIGDG